MALCYVLEMKLLSKTDSETVQILMKRSYVIAVWVVVIYLLPVCFVF
jgi:hypothetical protein